MVDGLEALTGADLGSQTEDSAGLPTADLPTAERATADLPPPTRRHIAIAASSSSQRQ
jgi:hypothetical protein